MVASFAVRGLTRPWAQRVAAYALVTLTITLFILNLRRTAERAQNPVYNAGFLRCPGGGIGRRTSFRY